MSDMYILLFADDQVVIPEEEDDTNYVIRKLLKEYAKWGMEINTKKLFWSDEKKLLERLPHKFLNGSHKDEEEEVVHQKDGKKVLKSP